MNSDVGVGRDSLSLLCGRRRVSVAGKFTGRHKTYGAFRDAPAPPNSIATRPNRRNALYSTQSCRRDNCTSALRAGVGGPSSKLVSS